MTPAGSDENISGVEGGIIDNTLSLVLLFFFPNSSHSSSLTYSGNVLKERLDYDLTKENTQLWLCSQSLRFL